MPETPASQYGFDNSQRYLTTMNNTLAEQRVIIPLHYIANKQGGLASGHPKQQRKIEDISLMNPTSGHHRSLSQNQQQHNFHPQIQHQDSNSSGSRISIKKNNFSNIVKGVGGKQNPKPPMQPFEPRLIKNSSTISNFQDSPMTIQDNISPLRGDYFKMSTAPKADFESYSQILIAKKPILTHKRSESMIDPQQSPYNAKKQLILNPIYEKSNSLFMAQQNLGGAHTQNVTFQNTSFQDASYLSHLGKEVNISSMGVSPIHRTQNNQYSNFTASKESYQFSNYMTIKAPETKKFPPPSAHKTRQIANQTIKSDKPIQTPELIQNKIKKPRIPQLPLSNSGLNSPTQKQQLLFIQRTNTNTVLPQIALKRRLDADLQEMFPRTTSHQQQPSNVSGVMETMLNDTSKEQSTRLGKRKDSGSNIHAKKYMKMIQKIIQKIPPLNSNVQPSNSTNTMQEQQKERLINARKILFDTRHSRTFSTIPQEPAQSLHLDSIHTTSHPSPCKLQIPLQHNATEDMIPIFQIQREEVYSPLYEEFQQAQEEEFKGQQTLGESTFLDVKSKKNQFHQSYQHKKKQDNQGENTPVFQKKQMNSDKSVINARFAGISLDKQSTEVSSNPFSLPGDRSSLTRSSQLNKNDSGGTIFIQNQGKQRESALESSLVVMRNRPSGYAGNVVKEEEGEGSSGEGEEKVYPKIKPIKKSETLFNTKIKVVPAKHRRQQTQNQSSLFQRFSQLFGEDKRYNEEGLALKRENTEQSLQNMGVLPVKEELLTVRSITTHNKSIVQQSLDKAKHWLLDSSRFDECLQTMQQQNALAAAVTEKSEHSDTVIFDHASSAGGTPPQIDSKKHQINLDLVKKSETLRATKSHLKSEQEGIINLAQYSESQRGKIEIRVPQTTEMSQDLLSNIEIHSLKEEDCSQLWEAHQSLIVNNIFSTHGSKVEINESARAEDIYQRMNVDSGEKLLLFPKFKLPTLDDYILPTYYDTIYTQNHQEPHLEQFNFNR